MFKLNFATPDKKVVAGEELEEITVPAFRGELNILPGHAPLMTTLEAGIVRYRLKSGETRKMAIGWGYCQISPEAVNVLAESAMAGGEIDLEVVSRKLKAEEEKLATESLDDKGWERANLEIGRLRAEAALAKQAKAH